MRKLMALSLATGVLVCSLSGSSLWGAAISNPHVAGDWQGWDAAADAMSETSSGSDIWTASFTGLTADSRHEFKVTDGTWDNSYPGANSWFIADSSGNITITYDGNIYSDGWSASSDRIGLSMDPGSWNAVGDWQSQVGGDDWDNANPNTLMNSVGGGIYEFSAVLAPGDYKWKAVVNGSWDSISLDNRSVGTADWDFSTDAINNMATFRVNALDGTAQIMVTPVPEPATMALLGLGSLLGVGLIRRRRS